MPPLKLLIPGENVLHRALHPLTTQNTHFPIPDDLRQGLHIPGAITLISRIALRTTLESSPYYLHTLLVSPIPTLPRSDMYHSYLTANA